MNYQSKVERFYREKVGRLPTFSQADNLLLEEWEELAWISGKHPNAPELKEMCDVMFCLYGLALSQGYDLDKAFEIICENNLTKPPSLDGSKVPKGVDYQPPDLSSCISTSAEEE